MLSEKAAARIDQVLDECADVPVGTDDPELAAIAVAMHLEESLGRTVPADVLDHEHLVPARALERTVRNRLVGP